MGTVCPRLAAGLIAAGLLLGGCGGSPEPKPLPAPTKSPSPSASATATPPVMPVAAKAKTKAGAETTVRFFLSSMEYSGDTGNTAQFEDTYTRDCTRCQAISDGIKKTYDDGGSIVGGAWHPTRLTFYAIDKNVAYLDAVVDYEAQTWIRDASGTKTTSPARRNVLKAFQLIWRDGMWRVAALDPKA
jgi:hypothetical protein